MTITANDGNGNTTQHTVTLTAKDVTAPSITGMPVNINVPTDGGGGATVSWTAPVATDNCSGASIALTAGQASGSVFPVGPTTVTYTATDAAGLTYSESFTVTVTDTELPIITAPAAVTVPADLNSCSAPNVVLGNPVTGDNCATLPATNDAPAYYPLGNTTGDLDGLRQPWQPQPRYPGGNRYRQSEADHHRSGQCHCLHRWGLVQRFGCSTGQYSGLRQLRYGHGEQRCPCDLSQGCDYCYLNGQ